MGCMDAVRLLKMVLRIYRFYNYGVCPIHEALNEGMGWFLRGETIGSLQQRMYRCR